MIAKRRSQLAAAFLTDCAQALRRAAVPLRPCRGKLPATEAGRDGVPGRVGCIAAARETASGEGGSGRKGGFGFREGVPVQAS